MASLNLSNCSADKILECIFSILDKKLAADSISNFMTLKSLTETAKSLILLKKQLLKLCLRRRRAGDDGLLGGVLEVKSWEGNFVSADAAAPTDTTLRMLYHAVVQANWGLFPATTMIRDLKRWPKGGLLGCFGDTDRLITTAVFVVGWLSFPQWNQHLKSSQSREEVCYSTVGLVYSCCVSWSRRSSQWRGIMITDEVMRG